MSTNLPTKYAGSKFVSGLAKAKDAAVARASNAQQAAKNATSAGATLMRTGVVAIPAAGACGAIDGAIGDRTDTIGAPEVVTLVAGLSSIVTGSCALANVAIGAGSASAYKHGRKVGAKYKLKMSA